MEDGKQLDILYNICRSRPVKLETIAKIIKNWKTASMEADLIICEVCIAAGLEKLSMNLA